MTPDFIVEMGWKSLLISGAALAMLALLRSRSAADRATLLRLSLVLLLALPILSLSLPSLVVEEPAPPAMLKPFLAVAPVHVLAGDAESPALPFALRGEDLVMTAYLAGVFLVTARLLLGLFALARWTRLAHPIADPQWRAALERAGGTGVRLLASDHAPSPMSWGLRRPAILIDRVSLSRPDNADAILAHEMAHVRRRDWPALMLSRLAVALFWFNPLVWALERCLVQHAEEAADLQAVVRVEPVGYARTLLDCVRATGLVAAPANSMAPGQGLARRLGAVLDPRQRGLASGSVWTTAAMAACVAVAAPVAALELIPPAAAPAAAPKTPATPTPARAGQEARAFGGLTSTEAQAVTRSRPGRQEGKTPDVVRASLAAPASSAPPSIKDAPAPLAADRKPARAAPLEVIKVSASALTLEEAIKLRALGVDTDQVEALAALGYRNLSLKQLVAMHMFRVTPAFIAELAALGYHGLSPEQLVELRVNRVTPANIQAWAAQGYTGLTADQMVQLRLRPDSQASVQQEITLRIIGGPGNAIRRTIVIGPSPEAQVEMRLGRAL